MAFSGALSNTCIVESLHLTSCDLNRCMLVKNVKGDFDGG